MPVHASTWTRGSAAPSPKSVQLCLVCRVALGMCLLCCLERTRETSELGVTHSGSAVWVPSDQSLCWRLKLCINSATDGCSNANQHLFMGSYAVYQHQKRGLVPLLSCLAWLFLSQLQSAFHRRWGQREISHICITKLMTGSKKTQQNIQSLLVWPGSEVSVVCS